MEHTGSTEALPEGRRIYLGGLHGKGKLEVARELAEHVASLRPRLMCGGDGALLLATTDADGNVLHACFGYPAANDCDPASVLWTLASRALDALTYDGIDEFAEGEGLLDGAVRVSSIVSAWESAKKARHVLSSCLRVLTLEPGNVDAIVEALSDADARAELDRIVWESGTFLVDGERAE